MAGSGKRVEVDGSIAYGNVADVEVTMREGAPVVAAAAAAKGGPERAWFCFRIAQPRRGRRLSRPFTLVLKHLQTMLGGGDPGALNPVVRYAAEDWRRLPAGKPAPTDDGRLGGWWTLEAPITFVDVALCYPYGQPEVAALVQETGALAVETIGVSEGGRPMLRLANDYGGPDGGRRPGVYLLGRQHAGEAPGSWVLDGLLRGLAGSPDSGPMVWAAPLVDIDGVEAGRYGKDHPPHDLNRAWGRPAMRHEALVLQADARRWADRCHPALMLDLHAPGIGETDGLYAYRTPGGSDEGWLELLERRLDDLAGEPFGREAMYPSRYERGQACGFFQNELGCPALTLEIPYSRCGDRVLDRETYREAGARIAAGLMERLGSR